MKKTLIALAVAGFVAAPAAMADVTVYGQGHISLDSVSGDNETGLITTATGNQSLAVTNRFSRLGVKAAEDLGGGLTAVAQMEFGIDMTGDSASTPVKGDNNVTARNQIIGLAGAFGTVALGRHDTPYKMSTGSLDVFADTAADYNVIIGSNILGTANFDTRGNDVVAYLSPDFNGFSFQAAIVAANLDGADDTDADDDDVADATSVAAQYKNGPMFLSVAVEQYADTAGGALDGGDAPAATKVGFGWDFGAAKLGAVAETQTNVGGDDLDQTALLVNVAVPMGGNTLIAEVGSKVLDVDGSSDPTVTLAAVGLAHGFSKNTSAYVAYGNVAVADAIVNGVEDPNVGILTAGMVVKF